MRPSDFTPQEVANLLRVPRREVYRLIHTGELRATRVGRRWKIASADLAQHLAPDRQKVVLTRRSVLRGLAVFCLEALFGGAVGFAVSDVVESGRKDEEAAALFQRIFNLEHSMHPFDYAYGRRTYWGSHHPYNRLAGEALAGPLGLRSSARRARQLPCGLPVQQQGDLVVFGGPNSTDETAIAWGFEGTDHRQLTRTHPAVPLRWYGVSAESEIERYRRQTITYGMGPGHVAHTQNWPFVDVVKSDLLVSDVSREPVSTVSGQPAYAPASNFLLITRIPNILDPWFNQYDVNSLPQLLVVEGTHGVGTRAAELLTREAGLRALAELDARLGTMKWFQALFEVYELEAAAGQTHRFKRISYTELHEMPRELAIYQRAHLQLRPQICPTPPSD